MGRESRLRGINVIVNRSYHYFRVLIIIYLSNKYERRVILVCFRRSQVAI